MSQKSSKKGVKKSVPEGVVYVNTTFNNTMITITSRTGDVVAWSSPGCHGFKGSRRGTPHAAQVAAKAAAAAALEFGMREVDIFVKGPGQARDMAVRELGLHFKVTSITERTPIPHNGCRPPKKRRV